MRKPVVQGHVILITILSCICIYLKSPKQQCHITQIAIREIQWWTLGSQQACGSLQSFRTVLIKDKYVCDLSDQIRNQWWWKEDVQLGNSDPLERVCSTGSSSNSFLSVDPKGKEPLYVKTSQTRCYVSGIGLYSSNEEREFETLPRPTERSSSSSIAWSWLRVWLSLSVSVYQ